MRIFRIGSWQNFPFPFLPGYLRSGNIILYPVRWVIWRRKILLKDPKGSYFPLTNSQITAKPFLYVLFWSNWKNFLSTTRGFVGICALAEITGLSFQDRMFSWKQLQQFWTFARRTNLSSVYNTLRGHWNVFACNGVFLSTCKNMHRQLQQFGNMIPFKSYMCRCKVEFPFGKFSLNLFPQVTNILQDPGHTAVSFEMGIPQILHTWS